MVQKIHPWGVIWIPNFRLMWADQLKKIDSSSVHIVHGLWNFFHCGVKNQLHYFLDHRLSSKIDLGLMLYCRVLLNGGCTELGNLSTKKYLYSSYGTVVRDFESEAKTR